jgi:hypothetical protein
VVAINSCQRTGMKYNFTDDHNTNNTSNNISRHNGGKIAAWITTSLTLLYMPL